MRTFRTTFLAVTMLAPVYAMAQPAPVLMPHRAVYDLKLDNASDRSGITGLSGRMVYEFNGSPCEGYTVNFRFVTEIDTSETTRVTDQQTTTYEDGDGKTFNFVTKSFVDQKLDREIKGTAKLEPQALEVQLDKPQESDLKLGATQFPTQHMLELLRRAEKGDTFYETSLYDGSDDADKVMMTTVVIGRQATGDASDPEAGPLKQLSSEAYWPVDIAYFDQMGDASHGEELPDYRISFKLHANGLTRDLVMDYGDFSLTGTLANLEMLKPAPECPKAE